MTVSEAIIQWLKQFAPEKMRQIDTDRMHGDVDFALVKETSLDKGTQRKTTENELPSLTQCTA